MKLCKDCRWVEAIGKTYVDYYCLHPLLQRPPYIDPVTGSQRRPRWLCETERGGPSGKCGPDGNLWEPKDSDAPRGFV